MNLQDSFFKVFNLFFDIIEIYMSVCIQSDANI